MATWNLIPAKEKDQENEMDIRGTLGVKVCILLEWRTHGWEEWRHFTRHENYFKKAGKMEKCDRKN